MIYYVEEYKAVAKKVMGYSDKIYIDKMKKIFPTSVKAALVGLDVTRALPKIWIKYLDLGLKVYKTIEDGKAPQKESSGNQSAKGKNKAKVNVVSISKTYEK